MSKNTTAKDGEEVAITPEVSNAELLAKISALEEAHKQDQAKLTMLEAVADKGRVFNYENQHAEKKPMRVKLSVYKEGLIIGWRTVKDELLKDPISGRYVGEVQEYEILILDKDSKTSKATIIGYENFSNARYTERVEVEVVNKVSNWEGKTSYTVQLPDGRKIELAEPFVN